MEPDDETLEQLHEYKSRWFTDGRSERVVCQGRAEFVEFFLKRTDFEDLFGGFVLSINDADEEFLGVWGRRKCSRFRRILRERGASFTVSTEAPNLRVKYKEIIDVPTK